MMNRSPMTEKTAPARPAPVRDLSRHLLPILLIVLSVALILFFVWLGSRATPESPPPDPSDTTAPPTETEEHTAVTYPSSPSRASYLLLGDGSPIDGTKLSAASAILVSLSDFSVKASIKPDERIYPASMTKIMTLIVACERIADASVLLTVTEDTVNYCAKNDAPTLAMDPGDSFSATDMLYAVGVISAADACITLADHIAGSEEAFVAWMNEKCTALGLTATHFANSTGLDDDSNYSTAREMAIILAYALDNPFCREILSTNSKTVIGHYTMDGEEKVYNRHLYNTLWSRLKDAGYEEKIPVALKSGKTLLGGKTGYTDKGKYCLASFASDKDGNLYILVTAAGATVKTSITDMDAVYTQYP